MQVHKKITNPNAITNPAICKVRRRVAQLIVTQLVKKFYFFLGSEGSLQ